ncbi:MAG: preprotein translocase subunit SecA [Bacteroidia bacterium]|nr:preprotein translocase subunit SecA [Bacteroidia bacterium]
MFGFLKKLFPSKKEKDVQSISPLVDQINEEYKKLRGISDDELRGKTAAFKEEIQTYISEIVTEMKSLRSQAETEENIEIKNRLYDQIDVLKKERNKAIEEALQGILPEAFAVVKETARRLTENKSLRVKATEWDKKIAENRPDIVVIEGDTAVWDNKWTVTGSEMEWNMVHYNVQLIGGIVLHQGKIAEMATGEGKTLVATLPVYLNALTGLGLHVVTVNNYLAQRDSEWNGPLFQFHGLSIDCIDRHEPNSESRRNAYLADITYGTNNEFGFDYLRDNMTTRPEFLVQREHQFAIIDEVDSVLIDEARTPLIISGPVAKGGDIQQYIDLKPRIERVVKKQKELTVKYLNEAKKLIESNDLKNGGIALLRAHRGLPKNTALIRYLSESGVKSVLNKTEGEYLQDNSKRMPEIDEPLCFTIDEKNNQIELTDLGREIIAQAGEDPDLFVLPDVGARFHEISLKNISEDEKIRLKDELSREYSQKSELLHAIQQLLKAYTLFEKDIEYIVQEGKVLIVDEQTGRVMHGRRYSDGLHQAIEAKENVQVEAATQTFATVTLQNFFRMYHKLCGMTGTAETEESEFYEIYKLDVVVIPTNRPISRNDMDDMIYKTKKAKYNAIIGEVERLRNAGRPVLVGTTNVEVSELLGKMLRMRNIPHNVLNAKYHQKEAEIVAEAGLPGNVTIATNMAGRGTDIKLGPGVKESGGLAIIGTERHESRRVDRQLRGRAGRQGDPGSSQFYISLEDDLMRLFSNVERVSAIMDRFGFKEEDVIQHGTITKQISAAQKKVEENNFAMRKRLLEYDDVMNSQREVIYKRRRNALYGDRIKIDLDNMLADLSRAIVDRYYDIADAEGLQIEAIRTLSIDPEISERDLNTEDSDKLAVKVYELAKAFYARKVNFISEMLFEGITQMRAQNPQIRQVVVPFTDGIHKIDLIVEVEDVFRTKGKYIADEMEKVTVLSIIDEKWKYHLRDMDELRQSVQNAVFEQKDPLLVYKFEAFELFQNALKNFNMEVISMLMKYDLVREEAPQEQKKVEVPKRDDFSKMKTQHQTAVEEELRRRKEEERRILAANSENPESNRPVSRRERREQDRKKR